MKILISRFENKLFITADPTPEPLLGSGLLFQFRDFEIWSSAVHKITPLCYFLPGTVDHLNPKPASITFPSAPAALRFHSLLLDALNAFGLHLHEQSFPKLPRQTSVHL